MPQEASRSLNTERRRTDAHAVADTDAQNYDLDSFTGDLDLLVASGLPERELTSKVAEGIIRLLRSSFTIADEMAIPREDHYVMRPLFVAPGGAYSVAAAVWNVGQGTPIHSHETWGVVGIYSGVEHEVRYAKPQRANEPLTALGTHDWHPGEVTICCTTGDDVHAVRCGSDVPCVGIHVYGSDIGTLPRRSYNPETGAVNWFISTWES